MAADEYGISVSAKLQIIDHSGHGKRYTSLGASYTASSHERAVAHTRVATIFPTDFAKWVFSIDKTHRVINRIENPNIFITSMLKARLKLSNL